MNNSAFIVVTQIRMSAAQIHVNTEEHARKALAVTLARVRMDTQGTTVKQVSYLIYVNRALIHY